MIAFKSAFPGGRVPGSAQILAFALTTDDGSVLEPFTLADETHAYGFDVDAVARSLRLDVVESTAATRG